MKYKDAISKYGKMNVDLSENKIDQVVLLYEGIIKFINNMKNAINENKLEEKHNNFVKAVDIITGLQCSLDQEKGGEVSESLDRFYSEMSMVLFRANMKNDLVLIENVIANFEQVVVSWREVASLEKNNKNEPMQLEISSIETKA